MTKKSTAAPEGGRPSKYRPEYAEQARKLCLVGYTDKDLADFFEISASTIDNWKRTIPWDRTTASV